MHCKAEGGTGSNGPAGSPLREAPPLLNYHPADPAEGEDDFEILDKKPIVIDERGDSEEDEPETVKTEKDRDLANELATLLKKTAELEVRLCLLISNMRITFDVLQARMKAEEADKAERAKRHRNGKTINRAVDLTLSDDEADTKSSRINNKKVKTEN